MKKTFAALFVAGTLSATPALAKDFSVEITNLTNGIYFTPLMIAAHSRGADVFEPGTPASANLQAMAEGGDISGLITELQAIGADIVDNPAGGVLAPGASATAMFKYSPHNPRLSVVAMLLPTNDGFVGLDSLEVPKHSGTYTIYLNGYDAGTEANNEVINGGGAPGVLGIPADPGGHSGSGAIGVTTSEANNTVHVHRGVLGDDDPGGGLSDLDASVHHWLNPVAKVVITVGRDKRY
ncbi:MAG: spondin domain-containing protein [Gammaproteobacteria bacterium]|nr:spondin domain-containing protein [Gammaproteobacteria bacterium]MDH3410963.1 spondin domain-containing protein [Gammaproteobacteria bacterium]